MTNSLHNVNVTSLSRDVNDKLPAYAWPGGYPIYYLTNKYFDVLCPDCATQELDEWIDADRRGPYIDPVIDTGDHYDGPQYADINYEDPDLYCVACGKLLDSAYGEEDN